MKRKLAAVICIIAMATIMAIPALAETKEVTHNEAEVAEIEEVSVLKATPSNSTPSDAEPEKPMYAYMYGMLVTHDYVAWMYPEMVYPYRYCLYHHQPSDIWYVCDLDTGRIYTDGFFGDEVYGVGFRFDHEPNNLRNLPTHIKKAPNAWCVRNWQCLCITKFDNGD